MSEKSITLIPTLQRRDHPLAQPAAQRRVLKDLAIPSFGATLKQAGVAPLRAADRIDVLQINVGKRCNQTCQHCHVDAGPDRREVMSRDVLEACLRLLEQTSIPTLDITGGAPELHPHFNEIVQRAYALGRHVIDRCNLTITRLPNYAYLPAFLAEHGVEIIASLPHYTAGDTDLQRGNGVFVQSIQALQQFSQLGYGYDNSGLLINLVTNPIGETLPADQSSLEAEWKRELWERYEIRFNRLYTLTNMPISRFLEHLVITEQLEPYMQLLVSNFNSATIDGLMCRNQISVGWDGHLYDCDFNQMLNMALPSTIFDVTVDDLTGRIIQIGAHCYGCTAASGST